MTFICEVIYSILDFVNIVLHSTGIFLLVVLYKKGNRGFPKLYIINLACSGLAWNMLAAALNVITAITRSYNHTGLALWFALWTGVNFNVICAMFYITGDRLLQVWLNIKYTFHWNVRKTSILIISTWITNVSISAGFAASLIVATSHSGDHIKRVYDVYVIVDTYVPPILQITYFIFSSITYCVMFMKYLKSKRIFQQPDSTSLSARKIFLRSRFFISVLLISSFLVLTVIPTLVCNIWALTSPHTFRMTNEPARIFMIYTNVSIRLTHTIDAVIYIFLQPRVRRLLIQKIFCRKTSIYNITMSRITGNTEHEQLILDDLRHTKPISRPEFEKQEQTL